MDGQPLSILPSDYDWQTKIYFRLVEHQKILNSMTASDKKEKVEESLGSVSKNRPWDPLPAPLAKRPRCSLSSDSSLASRLSFGPGPVTWTVSDLSKVSMLMANPPADLVFEDEYEMRRVFTLLYDVYRYKNVLNEALTDISFFYEYPELKSCCNRVWLLLFDLYHRRFRKRDPADLATAKDLFITCGLTKPESALWAMQVKLAAAIARIRIKNNALYLTNLLPPHLKDERVSLAPLISPVTCWINIRKVNSTQDAVDMLNMNLSIKPMPDKATMLGFDEFQWDPLCTQVVLFHPLRREEISQCAVVTKSQIVMQDRSFCFGPAMFNKLLAENQLGGNVIQTHVSSLRCTAYLANLLSLNGQVKRLYVFGAGERKTEYDEYLKELKVNNVVVCKERLIDIPTKSEVLQQSIAVYATPPNSYTAVCDPVDLVCSRGGDVSILQELTSCEQDDKNSDKFEQILEEQDATLRFVMACPQIQFVLYETHSCREAENNNMVNKVTSEMNRLVRIKHSEKQGLALNLPEDDVLSLNYSDSEEEDDEDVESLYEINNNEAKKKGKGDSESPIATSRSKKSINIEFDEEKLQEVEVPPSDLFEIAAPPDLCPNKDNCLNLQHEGCFIAVLQRKEITNFDAKYMIGIAEKRGLFGKKAEKSKTARSRGKPVKQAENIAEVVSARRKRKKVEVDRIAAHTQASLLRRHQKEGEEPYVHSCPRHPQRQDPEEKVPRARLWWAETARHLANLKGSLIRQKMIPSPRQKQPQSPTTFDGDGNKLDEMALEKTAGNIPVFPRLRLPRSAPKRARKPFPIYINYVEFPRHTYYITEDHAL